MNRFLAPRLIPEKADFRPALASSSLPGSIGRTMSKMSYGEQLRHPFWQRKRLQILEAACWACEGCGSKESTLHVHHRRYVKGRMAWEYEDHELQALCEACHGEQHEQRALLDQLIATGADLPVVIGLVAGYADCHMALLEDLDAPSRAIGREHFVLGQIAALLANVEKHRAGVSILSALAGGPVAVEQLNPAMQLALHRLLSEKGR